ncbi:MAG TPA: MBL fold metallo-hydrolase [Candidatus Mcinerneyibacteriales bacterium]|nr:MBL fold metallo-hydrolase [Candidatus Mcinerneyibacteriales bacterium]
MGKITMTVLVENESAQAGLSSEHGFSLFISIPPYGILFDTGQGGAIRGNMEQLGVCREDVTHFILSHGHYDHANGLPVFQEMKRKIPAFIHPMAVLPRYAVRPGDVRYIGMCRDHLRILGHFENPLDETFTTFRIDDQLFIGGHFAYENDFEKSSGPFYSDERGEHPDLFEDELALGIRTREGLVVVSGCSHHGIVNITRQMLRYGGCSRLRAVVGGLHLGGTSLEKRERTARELRKAGLGSLYAGHCTGKEALDSFRQILGEENVHPIPAGTVITLEKD